jgi:hypothetical protein
MRDKRLFRSSNALLWIVIALCIRICILAFFLHSARQVFPEKTIAKIGIKQSDYEYFMGPVDEYFEKGMFQYENSRGKPFAGRMPGYSLPYMLLRFIFKKETALFSMFLLQILLSAISVYLISRVAEKLLKNKNAFLITFFLFAFSSHTAIFDLFSLAESFSVSAICFFLYFIFKYFEERKTAHLLWSGFFITWAIFLRPFLGTMLVIFPLALFFYDRSNFSISNFIKTCFLFFIPFIICESAWIFRNFAVMKRFIPLETSLTESYGEMGAYRTSAISIREMIDAWGGESAEFDEGKEGGWFHHVPIEKAGDFVFDDYVFNSSFNKDSLLLLKKDFNASIGTTLSVTVRDSLNKRASATALRYADQYKHDNLFRYYLINPVKRFKRLVFSNVTGMLPLPRFEQMNVIQKTVKLFYFFLYMFITILGLAGTIVFFFSQKKLTAQGFILLIFPWLVAFTLVAYGVIGFRYYVNTYPVFIIFSTFLILLIFDHYSKKNNEVLS